jgi:hypothetical protein
MPDYMGRVNLEHTYYIKQIITVNAIVISLIYLVEQVSQNTRTIQIKAKHNSVMEYIILNRHYCVAGEVLQSRFLQWPEWPQWVKADT